MFSVPMPLTKRVETDPSYGRAAHPQQRCAALVGDLLSKGNRSRSQLHGPLSENSNA